MLNVFLNVKYNNIIILISFSLLIPGVHAVPPVGKEYDSEKLNARFFLSFLKQSRLCQIENAQD